MSKSNFSVIALTIGLTFACFGCKTPEPEVEVEQPKLAFEGAPDPKYAGTWKTDDGISTYVLEAAGTYKLSSKVQIQGQKPMFSNLKGNWCIDGDRMLFRDQSAQVSGYSYELKANKLTLISTGYLKSKTVMTRQP